MSAILPRCFFPNMLPTNDFCVTTVPGHACMHAVANRLSDSLFPEAFPEAC